jgi:hypothetical protein
VSIRRARLPFEGQYVQIPNAWMRDNRLCHRARGLLAEIMTHADGWVISQSSMWRNAPEGREAIRKAVAELVTYGYLAVDQERGEFGRFGEVNYVLQAPELAEVTATQKLGNGRKTGARSTAPQEMTPKEDQLQEDHLKKGGAGAPTPPPGSSDDRRPEPWCKRHAATEGADGACSACKAKRLAADQWDAEHIAASRSESWTPVRRKGGWDPTIHCEHAQLIGKCETCDIEAARAAAILQEQFGTNA